MAKIGNLQVAKIKIKSGALTQFYTNSGASGYQGALSVPDASNNPTTLYVRCRSSNYMYMLRTRGSKFIGSAEPFASQITVFFFDDDPVDGDVYTAYGFSGSQPWEISAVVRLK